MKRLMLGVVAALLLTSSAASAQTVPGYPGGCPSCVVLSNIDWATHSVVAGWAFECTTGEAVNRVEAWYQTDAGPWVPAKILPNGQVSFVNEFMQVPIPRPDVAGVFAPWCPRVTPNAGFHYYFAEPLPVGPRYIYVTTWRGNIMHGQTFHVGE